MDIAFVSLETSKSVTPDWNVHLHLSFTYKCVKQIEFGLQFSAETTFAVLVKSIEKLYFQLL